MKTIRLCIAALVVALIFSSAASAQTPYEQALARGTAGLEKGDLAVAEEAFRTALKEVPDDFRATLLLGVTLNKAGSKEAAGVLKKALRMNPQDPDVNLNLGLHYYDHAVFPEARDYFEATIDLAPQAGQAATAARYLEKMKGKAARRWGLDLALGLQYDSNVILGPDNTPLPEGISKKSDWLGVAYLKGHYDLLRSDALRTTASYSIYQSLYSKLSDFNITQQVAGLEAEYRLSPSLSVRASYSFEHVLVGGELYDTMHTLSPSAVFTYGKGFTTTLSYGYSSFRFSDSDLFKENSDRSGSNHRGTIAQFVPLSDSLDLRGGLAIDRDSTRKDFWSYSGAKVFAAVTVRPSAGLSADAYGEYYRKDYKGESPLSGTQRDDKTQTYSFSVTKMLSRACSLTLAQSFIHNRSNIEAFDYARAITSAFVSMRF